MTLCASWAFGQAEMRTVNIGDVVIIGTVVNENIRTARIDDLVVKGIDSLRCKILSPQGNGYNVRVRNDGGELIDIYVPGPLRYKYNYYRDEQDPRYTFRERKVISFFRASLHVGYGFYLGQYMNSMGFAADNPRHRSEPVFDLMLQMIPSASSGGRSAIGLEALMHFSAPAPTAQFAEGIQFENVTRADRGYNLFLGLGYTHTFTPRSAGSNIRHSIDIYPGYARFFQYFYSRPKGLHFENKYVTTYDGAGVRLAYGLKYKLSSSHAFEFKAGFLYAAYLNGGVSVRLYGSGQEIQKKENAVNASLVSLSVGYVFGRN